MDVALALIHIMETNPTRKQLYLSNKMDCFSYKGGCGECEHMYIEALGVKQYGSMPYCVLCLSVLQYIAILQYLIEFW